MEIKEGKLYFIKDEFIDKYNAKYQLIKNKDKGSKRPTYFCMRDIHNRDILWFIPMSTQYDKYMQKYIEIKEKIKKNQIILYLQTILQVEKQYSYCKICSQQLKNT